MVLQNFSFSTMDSSGTSLAANASLRAPLAPRDQTALSRTGHTVVAVFLGVIFLLGFLSNFFVLLVFARFPVLRTPINLILLNISVSDMLVCIFGTPFSFAASLYGRWLIGAHGCRWYGFANALFGIVSLASLALLSYERYSTILCHAKADSSDYSQAWLAIGASWLYSLVWTLPPLLGWSGYGPEGPGTTCSVTWQHGSAHSASYIACLFLFCLLLPLLLMIYCYGRILLAVRGVVRINQSSALRRERQVLVMVVSMVTCYLLCWMPYGVVALVATFGPAHLVTPTTSIIPSLLAKSSTVLNPVIYVLLNNQFYRCFMACLRCGSEAPPTDTLHTLPSSSVIGPDIMAPPPEEEVPLPATHTPLDGESPPRTPSGTPKGERPGLALGVHICT